jgi:hypothetical protein
VRITAEHITAMLCLPLTNRWQTESQLIGYSGLEDTVKIYNELADAGFCDRKFLPILNGLLCTGVIWMYRSTLRSRRAFYHANEAQIEDDHHG